MRYLLVLLFMNIVHSTVAMEEEQKKGCYSEQLIYFQKASSIISQCLFTEAKPKEKEIEAAQTIFNQTSTEIIGWNNMLTEGEKVEQRDAAEIFNWYNIALLFLGWHHLFNKFNNQEDDISQKLHIWWQKNDNFFLSKRAAMEIAAAWTWRPDGLVGFVQQQKCAKKVKRKQGAKAKKKLTSNNHFFKKLKRGNRNQGRKR